MPSSRSCSATMKRWLSLQTTIGAATSGRPLSRAAVSCSIVRSPTSGSSCLGYSSRDSGQSRVPEPPDRITGMSMLWIRLGQRHSRPMPKYCSPNACTSAGS